MQMFTIYSDLDIKCWLIYFIYFFYFLHFIFNPLLKLCYCSCNVFRFSTFHPTEGNVSTNLRC